MRINAMRIQESTDDLAQLLIRKNADYGDSFERQFNEYGLTSVCIRLEDKLNRLKNLVKNPAAVDETLKDTLDDLAGYAVLGSVLVEGDGNG